MTTSVSEWVASATHIVGDLVVNPVDATIHQCVRAGTSGVTPPVKWANHHAGATDRLSTTGDGTDGSAVIWQLTGLTALLTPGVGWFFTSV